MSEVTDEEIEEAIEALYLMERAEADTDHQRSIARVRRMVVGVYDKELSHDDLPQDKMETLAEVLEDISPENQAYHDVEYVEEWRERGLRWAMALAERNSD